MLLFDMQSVPFIYKYILYYITNRNHIVIGTTYKRLSCVTQHLFPTNAHNKCLFLKVL